ncbi:unnamed protein product [Litomosoides sigmodontis]|uniref:Uncharacterized protein n=1 Tax=Litomosoides sigmodontis TaxID=42156 RepID=A0A3P6SXY5_LITSI|nr:unnamed protein product [Litomosoides sigmodontis]
MLPLAIFLLLIPTLTLGMNYGWNYPYGCANCAYGYGQQPYPGYGQQPYPNYYSNPQPHGYIPSVSSISRAFRNYIYPAYYYYMPSFGSVLKSGAYGALKGAGAGAAIGGIVGLIG